jgi:RNA polymerase sigma-70 factor (ECF subfamily)
LIDADLVKQTLGGNLKAFEQLVDLHLDRVGKFLNWYGCPLDQVEDLTQEVFLKVFRKLNLYDQTKPFQTWLLVVAKHHFIDWTRKQKRDEIPATTTRECVAPTPEQAMAGKIAAEEVLELVSGIDRTIIELRIIQELPFSEIAEIIGEGESTIRSRLHRALKKLRSQEQLKEPYHG